MTVSITLERLRIPVLAVALALALSGCGRKAEPELPRATGPEASRTAFPVGPIGPSTAKPAEPAKTEKKSFPLDFLL